MKIDRKYFVPIGCIFIVITILLSFGIYFTLNLIFSGKEAIEEETGAAETTSILKEEGSSKSSNDPIQLIFIHHSTGENWLADENGGLGKALAEHNYFVSDTNYGWPSTDSAGSSQGSSVQVVQGIGDYTDIGHWWLWFRGRSSNNILKALYEESSQNSEYTRLDNNPGGENEIIMFKSCFPNSALKGNITDTVPEIGNNPLVGESSDSVYHTLANAKGIYIDLLNYFKDKQDKLFIVVTAPPLSDSTYASNAMEFNRWLANDWLKDYEYDNVKVFDLFTILADEKGILKYPSREGDDHPSREGNLKATEEFIVFIDEAVEEWQG
ncbi:SGNH/GDSL hydrolase family protein [Candidatus Dojkabacteria bacterium]|nr:SGNH/GDSL hydrolase family protein [Candidatus Dojkabacteria bacterium]